VAQILQLYQLQSLDSEITQINRQLADIAAKLGESEELQQARSETEAAQTMVRGAQTRTQDLDLELKSLTGKITNQEKLLYSGKVLNAKEAANLQEEVASLKRWQSDREEHLLEAMVELEEAEASLVAARARLNEVEAVWNTNQQDLLESHAALQNRLSELQQRRSSLTAQINTEGLAIYERLRPKKGGRAVAAVKGGVCQGCGVTPSNNTIRRARSGTDLTYCSACGRILYVP
jgi:predicted  nucleic acid-binding Zn-ribbon protein